eukprot:1154028-Pelagomonas_calceolata.AAC.18
MSLGQCGHVHGLQRAWNADRTSSPWHGFPAGLYLRTVWCCQQGSWRCRNLSKELHQNISGSLIQCSSIPINIYLKRTRTFLKTYKTSLVVTFVALPSSTSS